MNGSMENYLNIITPELDPNLVSSEALSHIQALAQILPSSSLAGFECRLGANQSGVDFQVRLPCLDQNLPETFLATPAWRFLQDFYRNWTMPNSSLKREIKNVGLEFDVNEQLPQVPIPCIFLQFREEAAISTAGLVQMVRLLNHQISPLLESNLQRFSNSLPAGATISHLGAMLARSGKAVRVNVQGISPEQSLEYLKQIGWTDPTNAFPTLVSTVSEFIDSIILSFDVGDTLFPIIGLECFLNKQPHAQPRWRLFLDYLVEKGVCTPVKKNAFLSWPGLSQKSSAPDLWPSNISVADRFLGSRAASVFWRRVSHIKLTYKQGVPLEAKGYLAFGHNWFASHTVNEN